MTYTIKKMANCKLCPRQCNTDRNTAVGVCGVSNTVKAAKACLHMWEEPPISGKNGSGAVFFSGCSLKCCFCQNYQISHEGFGREITEKRLSEIFLELQDKGANNINLVNPTHYVYQIINSLDMVKHRLHIPVVYNSGGYERTETLQLLQNYVDIYLPDMKYFSTELSTRYSKASDYFEYSSKAVLEMHRQQPELIWEGDMLKKGLVIRNLILPCCRQDSINIENFLSENLQKNSFIIILMIKYTPTFLRSQFPEINRKVTTFEYKSVLNEVIRCGIDGFTQDKQSAQLKYIPDFNLEGI